MTATILSVAAFALLFGLAGVLRPRMGCGGNCGGCSGACPHAEKDHG